MLLSAPLRKSLVLALDVQRFVVPNLKLDRVLAQHFNNAKSLVATAISLLLRTEWPRFFDCLDPKIQEISFPSLSNSFAMNWPALTSSLAPYTTLLFARSVPDVLLAHSCRLPYSSIEPPPTMKTRASEKPCLRCPKLAPVPGAWPRLVLGNAPGALTPLALARTADN